MRMLREVLRLYLALEMTCRAISRQDPPLCQQHVHRHAHHRAARAEKMATSEGAAALQRRAGGAAPGETRVARGVRRQHTAQRRRHAATQVRHCTAFQFAPNFGGTIQSRPSSDRNFTTRTASYGGRTADTADSMCRCPLTRQRSRLVWRSVAAPVPVHAAQGSRGMGTSHMNPVSSIDSKSAPTIENAKKWMLTMAERGEYAKNTARFRVGAIDALTSVLGEEESRDPKAILDKLSELAGRWARANNGKAETATGYESRARSLLRDYLSYLEDPTKFKPNNRSTAPRPVRTKNVEAPAGADPQSGEAAPVSPPTPKPASEGLRTFTVRPSGAIFEYRMPPEGLSMADVTKVAFHLVTMANDFDPAGGQVPNFSIIPKSGP